jgi:hypothetical protein
MGQTPKYGLRWPESTDPAEAWTAVGNLAADVERVVDGSANVPTPATGWAWDSTDGYGDGIELRRGRVVTIDGLLKRTGPPLTLSTPPTYTIVPLLTVANAPDPSRKFTGTAMLPAKGLACRWYIAGGSRSLGIVHPGGSATFTWQTGDALYVAVRFLLPV